MEGFLGFSRRELAAGTLALATAGAAIGFALPTPSERLLERCAETNGATLTVEQCFDYLAWLEFVSVCAEFVAEESEECVEIRTQEWSERGN